MREMVNLKYKEESPVADRMNKFQSVMNQFGTMLITLDDEIQALLLLSYLPDLWDPLVVTVSNETTDGKATMGQVISSLFNEEKKEKICRDRYFISFCY